MHNKSQKTANVMKKYEITSILKWGIVYSISLFIGNYILNQLNIAHIFLNLILMAFFVSIIAQVAKNHGHHESQFNLKWFIFYFLIYANLIWLIEKIIFSGMITQAGSLSVILTGFIISVVVFIIRKIGIKGHSIILINFILLVLLFVANIDSLNIDSTRSFVNTQLNSSLKTEEKQLCPTPLREMPKVTNTKVFKIVTMGPELSKLIDTSVWTIENGIGTCYAGKYKGQQLNGYYCEGMIVSRWDTSSAGTINHRWYTAVYAEWLPSNDGGWLFNGFKCENGQKLEVEKGKTNYYVHVNKDGSTVRIEY